MAENNQHLIAAISLFGEYKNNRKDAYDVIADFINATISIKRELSFNAEMLRGDLLELFEIDIPESVIIAVVKNRLKNVTTINKVYCLNELPSNSVTERISEVDNTYDVIFDSLYEFICKLDSTLQSKFSKESIKSQFASYLLDEEVDSSISRYFSAFIVNYQNDEAFKKYLLRLSSGLVSYYGVRYFNGISNIGSWTSPLTIYVDVEFMFNLSGYNNEYYNKVSNELVSLVKEINSKNKSKPLIKLKYLNYTKDVFDSIFRAAKELFEKKGIPDPSKKAVVKLIENSKDIFDIESQKALILNKLKQEGVEYDDNDYSNIITDPNYIIFNQCEIDKFNDQYSNRHNTLTNRRIDYYSNIYTVINGKRKGNNNCQFEQCRYIFLTASKTGRGISYEYSINNSKTIPFATDIDFIIAKFWYKLNKSFVNNNVPLSLDIVSRSQVALSEEVCYNVRKRFEELKSKSYSNEDNLAIYAEMRTIPTEIELYNRDNLPEIMTFISFDSTDAMLSAHYKLKKQAATSESQKEQISIYEKDIEGKTIAISTLQEQLKIEKRKSRIKINTKRIRKIRNLAFLSRCIYWLAFVMIIIGIVYCIYRILSLFESLPDKINFIITIVGLVGSVIVYVKLLHRKLYSKLDDKTIIKFVVNHRNNF